MPTNPRADPKKSLTAERFVATTGRDWRWTEASTPNRYRPFTNIDMKKIALFILAAMAVMALLSKLPSSAQARVVTVPTPTVAPVVSSR